MDGYTTVPQKTFEGRYVYIIYNELSKFTWLVSYIESQHDPPVD